MPHLFRLCHAARRPSEPTNFPGISRPPAGHFNQEQGKLTVIGSSVQELLNQQDGTAVGYNLLIEHLEKRVREVLTRGIIFHGHKCARRGQWFERTTFPPSCLLPSRNL